MGSISDLHLLRELAAEVVAQRGALDALQAEVQLVRAELDEVLTVAKVIADKVLADDD